MNLSSSFLLSKCTVIHSTVLSAFHGNVILIQCPGEQLHPFISQPPLLLGSLRSIRPLVSTYPPSFRRPERLTLRSIHVVIFISYYPKKTYFLLIGDLASVTSSNPFNFGTISVMVSLVSLYSRFLPRMYIEASNTPLSVSICRRF